jgi:hypothetical protein
MSHSRTVDEAEDEVDLGVEEVVDEVVREDEAVRAEEVARNRTRSRTSERIPFDPRLLYRWFYNIRCKI